MPLLFVARLNHLPVALTAIKTKHKLISTKCFRYVQYLTEESEQYACLALSLCAQPSQNKKSPIRQRTHVHQNIGLSLIVAYSFHWCQLCHCAVVPISFLFYLFLLYTIFKLF